MNFGNLTSNYTTQYSDESEEVEEKSFECRNLYSRDLISEDEVEQKPFYYNSNYLDNNANDLSIHTKRNWESLLIAHKDLGDEFGDKISHRIEKCIKPPITDVGLVCLRDDTIEANERIHQLLIKLRTSLCKNSNINYSIIYHDNSSNTYSQFSPPSPLQCDYEKSDVTLASDLVTAIRQNPEHIIITMHMINNNSHNKKAIFQIAFISIHRLLHPFSADNSMTTAILLTAINFQLDELVSVQNVFCNNDSKLIISRALFIHDPETAVCWDPFTSPMSLMPQAEDETVLTSLLRMYAIRRDVSTYFKIIWKPALPGVVSLLDSYALDNQSNSYLIKNTLLLAYRFLEYTFDSKSIIAFPSSASAVCRALYEVGDYSTIHSYLLQLLILPNLLKVLAGDHDSLENEDIYRQESIDQMINKYFDSSFWYNHSDITQQQQYLKVLDPIRCIVWITWKLYVSAIFMTEAQITVLTLQTFFDESFPLYETVDKSELDSYFSIPRLKNMIRRIREKIEKGCNDLLMLSLDIQGVGYLEIDKYNNHTQDNISSSPDYFKLKNIMKSRENMLNFKPNEILNLTVVSKYEIDFLFASIYSHMCESLQNNRFDLSWRSLYLAIDEYLKIPTNTSINTSSNEIILALTFLYESNNDNISKSEEKAHCQTENVLLNRYNQLVRGLKLCNRYEDTLIRMITRVKDGSISNIFEFAEEGDMGYEKHLLDSPEFDHSFGNDRSSVTNKHTVSSKTKQKKNNYGLAKPVDIPIFPLLSKYTKEDHHPNNVSLKELQKDIINSYRFGSKASVAAVGTSMARGKVLSPVVKLGTVHVTAKRSSSVYTESVDNRSKSKYTKIEINPHTSLLKPTESLINCSKRTSIEKDNIYQKDKKFMNHMRSYEVIPTQQFISRYKHRVQERMNQIPIGRNQQQYLNNDIYINNRQQFPEHLRNRIRKENIDSNRSISSSSKYSGSNRPRSPSLPIPIPHKTDFQSPTTSLLHKFATIDQESKMNFIPSKFQRDIQSGCIPLSRSYEFTASSVVHNSAFSPTARKIYSPTGARKPKVPMFLDPSINEFDSADYEVYNSGGESIYDSRSLSSKSLSSRSSTISRKSPLKRSSKSNNDLYFSDLSHISNRKKLNNLTTENHNNIVVNDFNTNAISYLSPCESNYENPYNSNGYLYERNYDLDESDRDCSTENNLFSNIQVDLKNDTTALEDNNNNNNKNNNNNNNNNKNNNNNNNHHLSTHHYEIPATSNSSKEDLRGDLLVCLNNNNDINKNNYNSNNNNLRNATLVRRKSLNKASKILDNNEILEMFQTGFVALKYGRRGAPKEKIVRFNEKSLTIEWQDCNHCIKMKSSFVNLFYVLSKQNKHTNKTENSEFGRDIGRSFISLPSINKVYRGIWK